MGERGKKKNSVKIFSKIRLLSGSTLSGSGGKHVGRIGNQKGKRKEERKKGLARAFRSCLASTFNPCMIAGISRSTRTVQEGKEGGKKRGKLFKRCAPLFTDFAGGRCEHQMDRLKWKGGRKKGKKIRSSVRF